MLLLFANIESIEEDFARFLVTQVRSTFVKIAKDLILLQILEQIITDYFSHRR